MKNALLKSTFTLFSLALSCQALSAENCLSDKAMIGETCVAKLEDIRPSQAAIGLFSIKDKAGKIEKEWAQDELEKYLQQESNPAVISPEGKLHIIDGHHFHYALATANIPKDRKHSYIDVIADFRSRSQAQFREFMIRNKYVYLKDAEFNDLPFDKLPKSFLALSDNPYRSLSWIAKERGCFEKTKTPFAEFLWGKFFKDKGLRLSSSLNAAEIGEAIVKAMRLCSAPEASTLPGYTAPSPHL